MILRDNPHCIEINLDFKVEPKGSITKFGISYVDRNRENHEALTKLIQYEPIHKFGLNRKANFTLFATFQGNYRKGGNDIDKLLRNLFDALTKAKLIYDDSYITTVSATRVVTRDKVDESVYFMLSVLDEEVTNG